MERRTKQDEFVFVVEGCPTLVTDEGRTQLSPGMCDLRAEFVDGAFRFTRKDGSSYG